MFSCVCVIVFVCMSCIWDVVVVTVVSGVYVSFMSVANVVCIPTKNTIVISNNSNFL